MKKELTEDQLIELARKAKPVPVEHTDRKKGGPKKDVSSIINFFQEIGIARGRNAVDKKLLYDAYCMYADSPLSRELFSNEVGRFLKIDNNAYKVNMKIITILEKVKELNDDKAKQDEVSGSK
jgi:hypothetical protein